MLRFLRYDYRLAINIVALALKMCCTKVWTLMELTKEEEDTLRKGVSLQQDSEVLNGINLMNNVSKHPFF